MGREGLGHLLVKLPDVFTEIFIRTARKGTRQVHLNGGATNGEYGGGWELHL